MCRANITLTLDNPILNLGCACEYLVGSLMGTGIDHRLSMTRAENRVIKEKKDKLIYT